MDDLPTGTGTFLFSDIEESARAWGDLAITQDDFEPAGIS